jgi:hypothetical protein
MVLWSLGGMREEEGQEGGRRKDRKERKERKRKRERRKEETTTVGIPPGNQEG